MRIPGTGNAAMRPAIGAFRTWSQDTSRNSIAGMQGKAHGAQDTGMHYCA
jgi:hypothetical protein